MYSRLKSVEVCLEASSYAAASLKLIRGTEEALNKQASSSVLYMFDKLRKIVAMSYIVSFERYMVCHLVNLGKAKRGYHYALMVRGLEGFDGGHAKK